MAEVPSGTSPALSVVIPAYNEAPNIEPCYRELVEVLARRRPLVRGRLRGRRLHRRHAETIRRLARADPRVRLVRLRRNAGQTAALDAGFRAARGAVVVTMDADLQNDPRDIPKLLAALPGQDAVCGWRVERHDPWTKRLASRVANRVRDRFTRDGVHDTGCTLKVFRREALQRLHLYRGMHRFLPALLQMEGMPGDGGARVPPPAAGGGLQVRELGASLGGPRRPVGGALDGAAEARLRDRAGGAVRRPLALLAVIGVAAVVAIEAVPFYTDWLWFQEVGYVPVFLRDRRDPRRAPDRAGSRHLPVHLAQPPSRRAGAAAGRLLGARGAARAAEPGRPGADPPALADPGGRRPRPLGRGLRERRVADRPALPARAAVRGLGPPVRPGRRPSTCSSSRSGGGRSAGASRSSCSRSSRRRSSTSSGGCSS